MNIFKNISKAVFIFILSFVVQIVSIIICCFITAFQSIANSNNQTAFLNSFEYQLESSEFVMWVSLLNAILSIIIFGGWYYKKNKALFTQSFNKDFLFLKNIKNLIYFIALVFLLENFCNNFILIVQEIFPNSLEKYQKILENAGIADLSSIPMIIYVCILGPICEEFIYRGIIFDYVLRTKNFWIANTLQAFLFGIMHGNIIQFSCAFLLGLVFGSVAYYSNSLSIVMFLHIGFNTYSMFAANWIVKYPGKEGSVLFILGTIGLSSLFGLGVYIVTKHIIKDLKNEKM